MFFFFLNFKDDNSNLPNIPSLESIRREWVDEKGEWYFAIADVIEALTDSSNPKQYIKKMRSRDSELNLKWGTICTPVVMVAADGKLRKIQAANMEGILRIVQSIPSPNAEPLKAWLAETGADYVSDIEAAQLLAEETDKRLAARNDVRSHNKTLADSAHAAGVKTNLDYAKFHNSGYRGLYGDSRIYFASTSTASNNWSAYLVAVDGVLYKSDKKTWNGKTTNSTVAGLSKDSGAALVKALQDRGFVAVGNISM